VGDERRNAATAVVQAVVDKDPDQAARLVLELGDFNVAVNFVYSWAQNEPDAAVRWADENLEGEMRIGVTGMVLPA
jgi:hypothetical protein